MTVHVGELTSEVQVHGGSASGGQGGGGGRTEQPTWDERVRMARVMDEHCREQERIVAERFDG